MKQYELVFILDPNLDVKSEQKEISNVEKLITSLKGVVKKKENWGKRNLAYPIKKFKEGIYVKFDLDFSQENIRKWENKIRLEEKVIRYLIVCSSTD